MLLLVTTDIFREFFALFENCLDVTYVLSVSAGLVFQKIYTAMKWYAITR